MKLLICPVNKAAFDMLQDPNPDTRKMEEYRAMTDFWAKRLTHNLYQSSNDPDFLEFYIQPKQFDAVKFTNGYGNKVPFVIREWKGLAIKNPEPKWVPEPMQYMCYQPYFAILLGEIINQSPS